MTSQEKLRNRVINKVRRLSDDKLRNLDLFLDEMGSRPQSKKSPLSFSGIFKDLDIEDLTNNLHEKRRDRNERIPEF